MPLTQVAKRVTRTAPTTSATMSGSLLRAHRPTSVSGVTARISAVIAGSTTQSGRRTRTRRTGSRESHPGRATGHAVDQAGRVAQRRPVIGEPDDLGAQAEVPFHLGGAVVGREIEVGVDALRVVLVEALQQELDRQPLRHRDAVELVLDA